MATILAHILVRPGCEARFEAIGRALYEATHANETHVRRYEYWRGSEPRTYYTLLSFDDFVGFLEHQTSDHHEEVAKDLRDVFEAFRLEWVDPIQGASPLVPTNGQAAPADASELMQRYAELYAPHVADWWATQRTGS